MIGAPLVRGLLGAVLQCSLLLSCARKESLPDEGGGPTISVTSASRDTSVSYRHLVRWESRPSGRLSAVLDSALQRLEASGPRAPDFRRGGTVRLLADTGLSMRYLLEAHRKGEAESLESSMGLYVLDLRSGTVVVSEPDLVPVASDVMNAFAVVSVDDVDADGFGDVAVCRWPSGQDSTGIGTVVGYKDQTWYSIPVPPRVHRACGR